MGHALKQSARAGTTPAFAILFEGQNELVQDGFTDDSYALAVSPDDHVIYAVDDKDGEFLGIIAYRFDEANDTTLLTLAYVEPSSRQKGIFKDMLHILDTEMKAKHNRRLMLNVWTANKIGHLVAQKCGFTVGWVEYRRGA
jgi:RimJ/RimL family protein N-acetyltransferase